MKKKGIVAALVLLGLLLLLGILLSQPVFLCKIEIPENYRMAIVSQSEGVYSRRLPLIPVYISEDRCLENRVFYTIYYFPLGTVEMSFHATEGYNIEKPLFPGA